jgi:biotin operon repressor
VNHMRPKYEARLAELERFLSQDYRTAAEIAAEFGCSRVAAYERIRALEELGCTLVQRQVRQGRKGPCAQAWRIPC